jgi:hypothetical protein
VDAQTFDKSRTIRRLSVAIVNWNTRDYLTDYLRSIFGNVKGISFKVIVVNNNSPDESTETVGKMFSWAKLVASHLNTCFAKVTI